MPEIYWEEKENVWFADCVEIDDEGEIPAASKTTSGAVRDNEIIPFALEEVNRDIARYEGTQGGNAQREGRRSNHARFHQERASFIPPMILVLLNQCCGVKSEVGPRACSRSCALASSA